MMGDGRMGSGGVAHCPRGPTNYYYMLPMKVRVQGLKIALTAKLAQGLKNYKLSETPTPDPHYLLHLVKHRLWGESVLIVDVTSLQPPLDLLRPSQPSRNS
ncbi:hypothetical protein Q8A67_003044 [Cirrhinus molitorella]|uniref:Large ribosomal subunit protein uL4m n=1 Tax=Cirrhinus molitorella TaxID=172907 RepID=A0AA88QEL8_9TELE|nr:hypothetical protein Q8A67_003044 [Cirrhinus molitorella]